MTDADMNPEPSWNEQPEGDNTPTASQILVHAREAKGLTQKQIAEQLYLSATFIRYIDEGEFQKLPKPAFIKGYLRSYARAVSVDPSVVVAAFDSAQHVAPQDPELGPVTDEAVGSGSFTGPVVQTGIISLIAVIVVAALVWWLASGSDDQPTVEQPDASELSQLPSNRLPEQSPPTAQVDRSGGSEAAQPEAQSIAPSGGSEDQSATPGVSDSTAGNAAVETTQPQPAAEQPAVAAPAGGQGQIADSDTKAASDVSIDRVVNGGTQEITVKAGGNDEMTFSFSDQCWVEITDGRGEKIYADLNQSGDVMSVYGVAPFEVLLGRAPGVTMTYKGNKVDLTRYTTSDQTAKIRTSRLQQG